MKQVNFYFTMHSFNCLFIFCINLCCGYHICSPKIPSQSAPSLFRSALESGTFIKIICGASNNDVALIRNICFIYTVAGCDCIDMSADEAVLTAAQHGIDHALKYAKHATRPLIMVSVNDFDDLHFRKAYFDPKKCPADCPRPCERVCPAWAIPPIDSKLINQEINGVLTDRCYGCGRCVPVCPLGYIETQSYTIDRSAIRRIFTSGRAQALEIHTHSGHEEHFSSLWRDIGYDVLENTQILAVSSSEGAPFLSELQRIIESNEGWDHFKGVQIWQADGRPMSGDIGRGTARHACELGQQILRDGKEKNTDSNEFALGKGKHYVQLAGGTNDYSIVVAQELGLVGSNGFGGFAFGGYARKKIGDGLRSLEERYPGARIEDHPEMLLNCLEFADRRLIRPIKHPSDN